MAIIALLVAILLPSLRRARVQAKTVVCASNLYQTSLAVQMYAADYKSFLPPMSGSENRQWVPPFLDKSVEPPVPVSSFGSYALSGGVSLLMGPPAGYGDVDYLPDTGVLFCPSDKLLAPNRVPGQWAPRT